MRGMVLEAFGKPLRLMELPAPVPGPGELLIRVHACAECRTDVHVVDGELAETKLPVIPGHEIVGTIVAKGSRAERFSIGMRAGVPWLGSTCGNCRYCRAGQENLCAEARFTGCTLDGGYAEYTVADERFCFPLPITYSDAEAAPLLCAGLGTCVSQAPAALQPNDAVRRVELEDAHDGL